MKEQLSFLIILLIIGTACSKEAIEKDNTNRPLDKHINLSNIKWGQESKYIAYTADCEDMASTFKYTNDTLVVRVIEEKEALFIEEQLTAYSTSFLNGEVTEIFRYPVEIQKDRLVLKERSSSRLFFFYDSDYLLLNFPVLMPTAYQEGCRLFLGETAFTGNELVQFPSFEVGPITLINKAAVSCRPIEEGEGYLIYDKKRLYMSHTITTTVAIDEEVLEVVVNGWQLLED